MNNPIMQSIAKSNIVKHYANIANSPVLIAFAIIDLLLVFFLIYYILTKMKNSKMVQLFKGIIILITLAIISESLQLYVISKILGSILRYGALALIIIFQPEIRRTLENMGRTRIGKTFGINILQNEDEVKYIYEIVKAAEDLSKSKTGALIVFEKNIELEEIVKTGTKVDAEVSVQILKNIFYPNTPLHDGAVIIKNGRVAYASTILPLSDDDTISKSYGTRHRAALGVSTVSDAIVLVVSEETGKISIAKQGKIITGYTSEGAKKELIEYFSIEKDISETQKDILRKIDDTDKEIDNINEENKILEEKGKEEIKEEQEKSKNNEKDKGDKNVD